MEKVGGGAGNGGYVEILHQFNLALGVPDTCRENGCADSLCPVVHAKTSGKQPVTVTDLDNVASPQTDGGEPPGK